MMSDNYMASRLALNCAYTLAASISNLIGACSKGIATISNFPKMWSFRGKIYGTRDTLQLRHVTGRRVQNHAFTPSKYEVIL